jgi:hypothetical protein
MLAKRFNILKVASIILMLALAFIALVNILNNITPGSKSCLSFNFLSFYAYVLGEPCLYEKNGTIY